VVIGCNTIGHLAAGWVHLQRIGDDTSGREWERTRKMGVNTLAFRAPQHGAFFEADADCVGLTNLVPWELTKQWLHLLSRSGTPLFVSASPDALSPQVRAALKTAFTYAAKPAPLAEPLDWLETTTPARWNFAGEEVEYQWAL
jgi:alpha-galactosidase